MTLTAEQISSIGIAGRVSSALSILGTLTIICAFVCSRHFRSPIHRIIFFNAFYNLFDSVATMISVSGPESGDFSPMCQFQGFALQMFPLADVLWTLAMALDTYLVVFHHYDTHYLQRLEPKYIGGITIVTFIPALVFLFIRSDEKGPVYGSETIWCSISPKWIILRLILYYGPVWLTIAVVLLFYALIGIEISRLRDEFKLTDDDHIALTSSLSSNNFNPEHTQGSVTTTVEASSTVPNADKSYLSESHITSHSSVEQAISPRSPANRAPMNYQSSQQRRVSFKQYILMPSLFFLALLATWVAPTINRVTTFVNPDSESFPLLLAVSAFGSLRGFWNGVIFITMGMKGWKRRAKERMVLRSARR
ncbi:uncharacterized protein N7484_011920 [Penicillium longicatenatum]|uniref:uncharacterized protein n=1 Tax=Penicillium longicatenatum TaxID=1561947 RepID=UPI0025488EB3|nr:uncharacterized protein N7484_011920 [Penicillium longicatenatum]KAJ5631820.1 hypothetical protein N7484_011920 [Penicillium longicatenatum]